MSWIFETYEQGKIVVEYRLNKGNAYFGYETIVGTKMPYGVVWANLFREIYKTEEQAKRSFQRQVRKVKKGDYQLCISKRLLKKALNM